MISIIIIGKNVGNTIDACIKSVYDLIFHYNIKDYEIIYIDSKSQDNTIALIKEFPEIKIFLLTGDCNAAIGRNVGSEEAKGDILFFVDGDMEISKDIFRHIFDKHNSLRYNIVSGEVIDIIYDNSRNIISTGNRSSFKSRGKNRYEPLNGGIFLIKKSIWDKYGGMNTKYKTGEEPDLGLRLAKQGELLYRINDTIAKHHTVHYQDPKRMWKMIFDKSAFYYRGLLYRNHLFNKYMYQRLWGSDKPFILLFLTLIMSFINIEISFYFTVLYFLLIFAKIFKNRKYKSLISFMNYLIYYIIYDLLNVIFLLIFFPRKRNISYTGIA